ncbi:MAG TPA: hypothetical protein PLG25_15460, partial [bacterium]|nr:hypothetical protein [bacterium]
QAFPLSAAMRLTDHQIGYMLPYAGNLHVPIVYRIPFYANVPRAKCMHCNEFAVKIMLRGRDDHVQTV